MSLRETTGIKMSVGCSVRVSFANIDKNSNTNADNHLIRQKQCFEYEHDYTKLNCKQGPCCFFFFPLMSFSFKSQDILFSLCLSFNLFL